MIQEKEFKKMQKQLNMKKLRYILKETAKQNEALKVARRC